MAILPAAGAPAKLHKLLLQLAADVSMATHAWLPAQHLCSMTNCTTRSCLAPAPYQGAGSRNDSPLPLPLTPTMWRQQAMAQHHTCACSPSP